MTEHEPTPQEEAEVTRLLADASGPLPMPESIASRLDDVLADLVAEREAAEVPSVVARRRRWPQVLVAAAAVSVIGYVGSVLPGGSSSSDQDGGATAGDSASLREVPPSAADEGAADSEDNERDGASGAPQDLAGIDGLWSSYAANKLDEAVTSPQNAARCRVPTLVDGERSLEVRTNDGRRAVVVVRPLNGSATRADLYPCQRPLFPVASSLLLAAR